MARELISTQRLTSHERAFVRALSRAGRPGAAAVDAGYTGKQPDRYAYELLATPHIALALHNEIRRQMVVDAPASFAVLRELRDDVDISPKVRFDCARTLLDRAGHVAPRATIDRNQADKPLHELSTDELRTMADRLEGELAERAKPVISARAAPERDDDTDIIG